MSKLSNNAKSHSGLFTQGILDERCAYSALSFDTAQVSHLYICQARIGQLAVKLILLKVSMIKRTTKVDLQTRNSSCYYLLTCSPATIHTDPGCSLPSDNPASLAITGTVVGGLNCAAAESGNQGCGVRAPTNDTYGPQFNLNGGGVYASQSELAGIPDMLLTIYL
jgi:hypothetical protein